MRNTSNLNDLMMSLTGKTDSKLGFTTTVKEQVDDIEVKVKSFRLLSITLKNHWRHSANSRVSYNSN